MDRPKRPTKVTDYRRYHLSGDLDQVVQGKVVQAIHKLSLNKTTSMTSVNEDGNQGQSPLSTELPEQHEHNQRLQKEVEEMRVRNELEIGKMQQQQWELALQQLKKAREEALAEHRQNMEKMQDMGPPPQTHKRNQAVAWLEQQIGREQATPPTPGEREPPEEAQHLLAELRAQQLELQERIDSITKQATPSSSPEDLPTRLRQALASKTGSKVDQDILMEQIRTALAPKAEEKDHNKALLRALLTNQNKMTGVSGTTTLKPELLGKLTAEEFSMPTWLASLNKQEEGESEINKILHKLDDEESDCRHGKMKSGMLDKSTTNIRRKETWPQKNLGEEWAEEEIEFRQLRFEHLVAGETRTIQTCADPAQILGRLRLL